MPPTPPLRSSPWLPLVFGVALGAGCVLLSGPGFGDPPPPSSAERGDTTGEVQRLREQIEAMRANPDLGAPGRELGTATPADAAAAPSAAGPVEASAPTAAPPDAQALADLLLAELQDQIALGELRPVVLANPPRFAELLLQTWLERNQPARALELYRRLPQGTLGAGVLAGIAARLEKQGDAATARAAVLLGMQHEGTNWALVRAAAKLDPAAALVLLEDALGRETLVADPQGDAKRVCLLLAARRRDEARALLASMRAKEARGPRDGQDDVEGEGDGDGSGNWLEIVVEQDPRLALELLGPEEQATDQQRELHRAEAFRRLGDAAGEKQVLTRVAERHGGDAQAWARLAEMDPAGTLQLAERLLTGSENANVRAWRARLLAKVGRRDEAIVAFQQMMAVDWDTASRGLLRLAPELIRDEGMRRRDDELIGDLADEAWRAGRREEAVGLWQRAREFDPGDGEWTGKLQRARAGQDPLR